MSEPMSAERVAAICRRSATEDVTHDGRRHLSTVHLDRRALIAEVERLRAELAERTDERDGIHRTANGLQEQVNDSDRRTNRLAQLIDVVAIPSLRYCETKHGYDDQARLNLEAGTTEALCYGLPDELAARVRATREHGPASAMLDDAEAVGE